MMSIQIRRNTFVMSEPRNSEASSSMSGIDKQNVMRLRINRIALVQELKIDHIIKHLMQKGIITEADRRKIESGTTHSDCARKLIDMMTTKTNLPDWYNTFRDAMLNADADAEQRKRYRSLVEFLDNTVIHRPNSQHTRFSIDSSDKMKLPHYPALPAIEKNTQGKPQNVLNLDEDRQKQSEDSELEKRNKDMVPEHGDKFMPWSHENQDSVTLVKGFFQQWVTTPDNFRSLIQVPEEHFQSLQESSHPDDKAQLELETKALEKIRKLELVAVLSRRKSLPNGFELCMCDIVHDILFDTENHHLYFKYLKNLEESEVNLLVDIVNSYASIMETMDPAKSGENTEHAIKLGFHMIDFLADYGYFKEAELIMAVLLVVLNQTHKLDTWMAKFNGFVKLMHFRNMNYEFSRVLNAFNMATEMSWQIEMMSFGQHVLYRGELNTEICQLMMEKGAFTSAFSWARAALKEVKGDNPVHIINALCVAVIAYCSRWFVKKAEELAIHTVQQARETFGARHPMYVKALLTYCHFSSEFRQDQAGVDIAKHTLAVAKKVFGCDMLMVALAHRAVCKAMLVMQKFDDLNYSYHAQEGLKIARVLFHDNHPILYLFLHTAASALQWNALHSSKEMQGATLKLAETEAKVAYILVAEHYGEISVRSAQMLSLLGQVYSKMDRLKEAEEMLQKSVAYFKLCVPRRSHFLLLAMATLGTFYKIFDRPKEAILMFKQVIENLEPNGVYLKWVHVCFDHLISALQSINKNREADEVQILLSQWLRDNPVYDHVVRLEDLHERPPAFTKFMEDFDPWEKHSRNIMDKIKSLKENEDKQTDK